ncbi:protein NPGR2 isoform X3 [Mangifera indica]|uniref:protein NPGR2 isoform X3 n=1 Tax=Mangifera indica TaxID=29780 RepID=UPI001CFA7838|nr:protein NPGR2 isoform X3 [Mangifera indica]
MQKTGRIKPEFEKFMKCIFSGQQLKAAGQMIPSSESQNCSASGYSSRPCEAEKQPDTGNLEEAEWSLRESSSLNYEEARALLGRIEYQKGNIEAALHVFEGIDIAAATPKMKITLASKRGERHKRHSKNFASPPMSNRAVSLLLEAIFLKAKSLQVLGRFKEAAQACKVILDIIESSLPEGFPENLGADCKLQETVSKAVELLPELWKLADSPREAVLSYRRALLHHWNLDTETTAKIQKEFAVFLLYFGGDLRSLANKVEELPPGTISRKEMYYILAFCYHGAGEDAVALNLLRKLLSSVEDPRCVSALLLASKVCAENPDLAEEGTSFACRALECLEGECDQLESTANCLLGISLSAQCKLTITDSERITKQSKALKVLESTGRSTGMRDPNILYHLSLENAEQRKLDAALYYAKSFLKLDGGSNVKGWLLMARILSAQRRFADAESIISAALDQSGKWDQGNLLRTKAKLQIAQGQVKTAIETYTQLLAVLQVQSKTFSSGRKLHKGCENPASSLELDVWHDLAFVYISLSQWRDAEVCLSKSKAIGSFSATRCYATGVLYQRKGLHKEALQAFGSALDIDPTHVPSLISTALVLKKLSEKSNAVIRSFLMAALRLDRMNPFAWYNLGLVYKSEGTKCSALEAAECFQVAATLEESAPVEPFR